MATFGRDGEGTTIGTHVKLEGVLVDPADITVLGHINGEVRSDQTVAIGENASLKGPLTARRAVIGGKVEGNVMALERLEILPRGQVEGNVETRDLVIHSGAVFNGRSTILGGETPRQEQPAEPSPPPVETRPTPPAAEPAPPARRRWPIRLAGLGRPEQPSERVPQLNNKDEDKKDDRPTYEVE